MALIDRMNADAPPAKTLRDEFAMVALSGLCAIPGWPGIRQVAETAYDIADAMLAVRGDGQ